MWLELKDACLLERSDLTFFIQWLSIDLALLGHLKTDELSKGKGL